MNTTQTQIRICFNEKYPEIYQGVWRLDVGRPGLVFERMRNAVLGCTSFPTLIFIWKLTTAFAVSVDLDDVLQTEDQLRASSSPPSPSPTSNTSSSGDHISVIDILTDLEHETDRSSWREFILQGTGLRDVLLRGFRSGSVRCKDNGDGDGAMDSLDHIDGIDENVVDTADIDVDADTVQRELDEDKERKKNAGTFADDQRIQSWARRYAMSPPLVMEGDPPLVGLNESQVKAVACMVGNRVSLVQGPPGTGKTKTILHTLLLLKRHFAVPHPILVCTYTNVAVDNLVEGLAAAGLAPLRVGFGPAIRPSVIEHSLHRKLEVHERNGELKAMQAEEKGASERVEGLTERVNSIERDLIDLRRSGGGDKKVARLESTLRNLRAGLVRSTKALGAVKGKIYAVQQEMLREVVGGAEVICTTCITAATSSLGVVDFPVVFLDEASMCTEPASLIPIMKGVSAIFTLKRWFGCGL